MRWLPVLGYEGFYEVSDSGVVRSVARVVVDSRGRPRRLQSRVISPRVHDGYWYLRLSRGGVSVDKTVHSLVLSAFDPCPPGPLRFEVRHKDNDRTNCALSNLEWGTPSDNQRDRERHGTSNHKRREACDLEHLLVDPNLVQSQLKLGYKKCRACAGGRARVFNARRRNGAELDFRVEADRIYEQLMSNHQECASGGGSAVA